MLRNAARPRVQGKFHSRYVRMRQGFYLEFGVWYVKIREEMIKNSAEHTVLQEVIESSQRVSFWPKYASDLSM